MSKSMWLVPVMGFLVIGVLVTSAGLSKKFVQQMSPPTIGERCNPQSVVCRCGLERREVSIDIQQCVRWTTSGRSYCEPCPGRDAIKACALLPTCRQCSETARYFADWCANIQAACKCQNGGECLHAGLCLCKINFTGKYCEARSDSRMSATTDSAVSDSETSNSATSDSATLDSVTSDSLTSVSSNFSADRNEHCPLPNYPINGKTIFDTELLSQDDYVKYTCDDGYTLIGDVVRHCTGNGQMTGVEPKCEKLCPIPKVGNDLVGINMILNPENDTSMIDAFGNLIINVIDFYCDEGLRMSGSSRLRCVGGKWDKEMPNCMWFGASCPDPGIPSKANRSPDASSAYWAPGTTFKYTCDNGSAIYGKDTIVCAYSGQWSSLPPQCLPIIEPTTELDQHPNSSGQTARGSSATTEVVSINAMQFSTTLAARAVEVPVTTSKSTVIFSNSSATSTTSSHNLTGSACKSCCPQPLPLKHGKRQWIGRLISSETVPISNSDDMTQGTTISYKCDNYYQLENSALRTCRPNNLWSGEEPKCKPICGILNEDKAGLIVGGQPSKAGKWPWPVALVNQNVGSQFCSGTLLSENWVVTAAHCTEEVSAADVIIYLGKTSWDQPWKDSGVTFRKVKQIIVHDDYNNQDFDSDIALLMMSDPVELDRDFRPACLPRDDSTVTYIAGTFGIVTGWGRTDPLVNKVSSTLQEIAIPLVDSFLCQNNYKNFSRNVDHKDVIITDNMFCAGFEQGGRGVCKGDSGSGVYFNISHNGHQVYVLEGIVSWGAEFNCVAPGLYAGFVRVRNFVGWIRNQITDFV